MIMNTKILYGKWMPTVCVFLFMLVLLTPAAHAHSGRTDSSGGHNSPDGYHYHHGYPAHQHYDIDGDGIIDCPYNFVDAAEHNSKEKDSSTVATTNNNSANSKKINNRLSAGDITNSIIASVVIVFYIAAIVCYTYSSNITQFIDKIRKHDKKK